MKNVVVIGGGTGLSNMLKGMKEIPDIHLTAIVTVADDGGSTGRIRDTYKVPAMGDIRDVLASLADESQSEFLLDLMNYRFEGKEDVGGHSLGNLIFLALMEKTHSFMGAIELLAKELHIQADVLPSTLDMATLYALMDDGTLVRGEKNIPIVSNSIYRVFYQESVHGYSKAIEAIREADLIIYGIGSLYTSVIPNLIIEEISQAIYENPCDRVFFCNVVSQPGETDQYSLEDHIDAIERHSFKSPVDIAIMSDSKIDENILQKYRKEGSHLIRQKEGEHVYKILRRDLAMIDDKNRIRHNPQAIKEVVEEILEMI